MENKPFCVLKSSKDFEFLKSNGKRYFIDKKILVCYHTNSLENFRVGWTLSRSVGNAVLRNKLKRFSREFFRTETKISTKKYYDINLVFLKSGSKHFKSMDYNEFETLLRPSWQKIINS